MDPDLRYTLIEDHAGDGLRAGEGSVATLRDGRLLLFYSRFLQGGKDGDPSHIAARISCDGGNSWSDPRPHFLPPAGALNVMSASLLRLDDGRLICVFLVKWSEHHMTPMATWSGDDGVTWTEPVPLSDEKEYFCVNNDRLVQLADATLVLPYARLKSTETHPAESDQRWNMLCGLFFSHDRGRTWRRSPHEVAHTPEVFTPPLVDSPLHQHGDLAHQITHRLGVFQEPGVQPLSDGRLLLYMRSSYAIYRCFAESVEAPWKDCGIFPGLNVCCGPQTIRRLPGSGQLIMLYNDRGNLAWGEPGFRDRTPLSVALSSDEGKTWERWGQLENDTHNYCYFSLLFSGDRFLATYYQSGNPAPGGKPARRNLASLKACSGPVEIFGPKGEREPAGEFPALTGGFQT